MALSPHTAIRNAQRYNPLKRARETDTSEFTTILNIPRRCTCYYGVDGGPLYAIYCARPFFARIRILKDFIIDYAFSEIKKRFGETLGFKRPKWISANPILVGVYREVLKRHRRYRVA